MKRSLLLGAVLPAVLVLAAAGGGAVYVAHTMDTADTTAPTVVWPKHDASVDPERRPDPARGFAKGRTDSALARQLLPVPDGYVLGPDIDGLGNDRVLSRAESVAFLKQAGKDTFGLDDVPSHDTSKIKGLAVRSYASESKSLVFEVRMTEMTNVAAARDLYPDVPDAAGRFGVPGHPGAQCFTEPKDHDHPNDLAEAACVAVSGDVAVVVLAYGAAPLGHADVADMTARQLGHLVSPGASV